MLFGEYALLEGSLALTMPFSGFSGILELRASNEAAQKSHESVRAFSEALLEQFQDFIKVDELTAHLEQGLFFNANIPQGYGVGSSAALVAALLHHYGKNLPETLPEKKAFFGEVESYFHGKSSGLDVLASFENKTLIMNAKGEIKPMQLKENRPLNVHLIDSNQVGITSDMVNHFRLLGDDFKARFKAQYVDTTNLAIAAFLNNYQQGLMDHVKVLSQFALDHMDFAIPSSQLEMWSQGLSSGNYFMKLCGSGGGGFSLVFSTNDEKLDFPNSIKVL